MRNKWCTYCNEYMYNCLCIIEVSVENCGGEVYKLTRKVLNEKRKNY